MNLHYKSLLSASILMALTACGGSSSSDGDSPNPTPSEEISVTINTVNTSDYDNNKQACNQTSANKDFCNLRIYQVMVESFQDGDSNIGYGTGYGTSHHKGDLKGIIKSLDYIKGLGMNAIWLTPIFDSSKKVSNNDNKLDATGYYANSYKEIDPNFGTKDDLKTLVEEAHARGIYVFLDGVFGHSKSNVDTTSPNNERLVTTNKCIGRDGNEYDADSATTCSDFKDKDNQSQNNEFFKDVATHYIKEYKIDGWRLDQAYQLPVDSWKEIREAVEKAASQTTYTMNNEEVKPLGYMVGEIWDSNQQINNRGYGANAGDGLLSVFGFNLRYAIVQTLAVEEDWKKSNHKGTHLLTGFKKNANELTANTYSNLFITNHDVVRFGDLIQRAKKKGQLEELLYSNRAKAALSLLATYSGPITNYYGEEIGQEVPYFDVSLEKNVCSNKGLCDDHVSRDSGKITGFNESEQALHDYMANLMNVRSKLPSLYNGTLNVLTVDDNLFSMLKKDITTTKNLDAIYLLNVNEKVTIKADISSNLDDKDYSELVDVATCETFEAESENVTVKLEPLQNRILVSKATANEIGVCNN